MRGGILTLPGFDYKSLRVEEMKAGRIDEPLESDLKPAKELCE